MKKKEKEYDYFLLHSHLRDATDKFFKYLLKKYPADFKAMCGQRLDNNIKFEMYLNGIEINGTVISGCETKNI